MRSDLNFGLPRSTAVTNCASVNSFRLTCALRTALALILSLLLVCTLALNLLKMP